MEKKYTFVFVIITTLIFTTIFYFYLWKGNYVYITVAIISGTVWATFYFLRKDLRTKMLIMSLATAPLIVFDTFFIPEYYNPWFYNVIPLSGDVFLGSILTAFFWGGIFTVIAQIFTKKTLYKTNKVSPSIFLTTPAIFSLYCLVPLEINPMNWWILANFVACIVIFFSVKREMIKNMFLNALYVLLFYIPLFYFIWFSFPAVPFSYSSFGLIGVKIFGAPIEEFIWAFSAGLIAGPVYEIIRDLTEKKTFKSKL